ncbi:MAG: hypothetical protein FWC91_04865 [Defluviitaleaceae bacterium]|nr:hypothetical protein [Defluviitaleaceae bacterium]
MNFILATSNPRKVEELQAILGTKHNVSTLADIGFDNEIIEDKATFAENASIKVKAIQFRRKYFF